MSDTISVTFWGVRGSMPCTSTQYKKFGGNTICLEVSIGGQILAVDMGSGARDFGQKLYHAKHNTPLPVLFSHLHLDHLLGLPFFAPLYNKEMHVSFYGASQHFGHGSLESALQKFCSPPFFPVGFLEMPAHVTCNDFRPEDVLQPFDDDVTVRTVEIPHPNGCVGYRFDYKGKSLGLLCDMMPIQESESTIYDVMRGVDALVVDAAYSDAQYAARAHWGHCSWPYVLELARKLGAPPTYIIHHDMLNDDAVLDKMQKEAQAEYDDIVFVQEGFTVTI